MQYAVLYLCDGACLRSLTKSRSLMLTVFITDCVVAESASEPAERPVERARFDGVSSICQSIYSRLSKKQEKLQSPEVER